MGHFSPMYSFRVAWGSPFLSRKNSNRDTLSFYDWSIWHRLASGYPHMLKLREELLFVEEDRLQGRCGCTIDELDSYLDDIIVGA